MSVFDSVDGDWLLVHDLWKRKGRKLLRFTMVHPQATTAMLGYIPTFLSESDPRSAREQLNANYAHGGGYDPFPGFKMLPDLNLQYPGDPPTRLLAFAELRDERILMYEHSWVAIVQKDGSWVVSRMD
jgi:hypothetical protein